MLARRHARTHEAQFETFAHLMIQTTVLMHGWLNDGVRGNTTMQSCSVWITEDGARVLAFGGFPEPAADRRHGFMPDHEISL